MHILLRNYEEIKRNGYYNKWGYLAYKAKIAEEKRIKKRLKVNHKHIKLCKIENIGFYKILIGLLKFHKGLIHISVHFGI